MSGCGSTRSSRHYDRASSAASVPDGRSPLERIRSLERKRNMERRREQFRREQGLQAPPQTRMSIAERVRAELKKLLSRTTEDVSDDETDSDSEEGVRRGGNPGVGILWKMSFCATMSLFAYVFLSGPRVQVNFVPDVVERDPIPRIRPRPRNRRARTST